MIDADLRQRALRLLSGRRQVEDLDRLFLGLRDRHHGRTGFREIGDFVAHREERQKGLVTQISRDVFTSVSIWSLGLRGRKPTRADIAEAAWANFRLASDLQLKRGCGLQRGTIKRRLESGLPKFERGVALADQEMRVIAYLGNRFIWKPAITDDQLFEEFCEVLLQNSIISKADRTALDGAKTFLTLYAISCMHGSAILLEDGTRGELLAGFANRDRYLEVKIQIRFNDTAKPITTPICMFLSTLHPEDHCNTKLLEQGSEWLSDAWREPIEVGPDGRLSLID